MDLSQIYSNPEEKLWHVVKHYSGKNQQQGIRLEQGDIIKLGRVRLRVRDVDYSQMDPKFIPT